MEKLTPPSLNNKIDFLINQLYIIKNYSVCDLNVIRKFKSIKNRLNIL